MSKGIIIFGAVLLLLVVGAIFLYFYFERPAETEVPPMHNINIRIFDEQTNKQIKTDFVVTTTDMNILYKQGTTTTTGFVKIEVPVNITFRVFNVNEVNQRYYTSFVVNEEKNGVPSDYRIDLPVTNGGNLTIVPLSIFPDDNPFILRLTSKGTVKNLGFCARWSDNIIGVYADKYVSEVLPYRYKSGLTVYDRCWNVGKDLKEGEEIIVKLRWNKFGEVDSGDYIRLVFMDGDIRYSEPTLIFREDVNHNDTGIPDVVYVIKK